jgi:hypothetical protein
MPGMICYSVSNINWSLIVAENLQTLLIDQNLYVEAEDLEKLGVLDDGVQLPNGGYYASLMVYHQLHCLVRSSLYISMYRANKETRNVFITIFMKISTFQTSQTRKESSIESTIVGYYAFTKIPC